MSLSQNLVTINILALEQETRHSKRTGNDYNHFAARCIVLNEDFSPVTVGTIRSDAISPELRANVAVGLFRAVFSLVVPDFGKDQGNIVSRLVSLTPVTPPLIPPAARSPAKPT